MTRTLSPTLGYVLPLRSESPCQVSTLTPLLIYPDLCVSYHLHNLLCMSSRELTKVKRSHCVLHSSNCHSLTLPQPSMSFKLLPFHTFSTDPVIYLILRRCPDDLFTWVKHSLNPEKPPLVVKIFSESGVDLKLWKDIKSRKDSTKVFFLTGHFT